MHEFEKTNSKIFFHKLNQQFVNKWIGNQLSIKFMKLKKQLYAIISMPAWVPQEFRNKTLKHFLNSQMIGSALKAWNMYDSKKQRCVDKWKRTQNHIVCIKFWFNRHVNMNICSYYVISKGDIQSWK
jgi:hypothetical protein